MTPTLPSPPAPTTGLTGPATDSRAVPPALVTAATVAAGLMAGTFYAYSVSVMVGLHRLDDPTFVTVMQEINEVTPNAAFLPVLLGSVALPAAAAAVAVRRRSAARHGLVVAAGLAAAAFLVTVGANVPLNDELKAAGPVAGIANVAQVRDDFEGPWTLWNHARAALTTGTLVALTVATRRNRARA